MAKNTIFAGGVDTNRPIVDEAVCGAIILPGKAMLKSSGSFTLSTVNGEGGAMYIAAENSMKQGTVDDTYASGETVKAFYPRPGEMYNVRVATGNNITAKDTPLTVNAAGRFRIALTDGTEEVLAYADEVVNVAADDVLVRVRWANAGRAS